MYPKLDHRLMVLGHNPIFCAIGLALENPRNSEAESAATFIETLSFCLFVLFISAVIKQRSQNWPYGEISKFKEALTN